MRVVLFVPIVALAGLIVGFAAMEQAEAAKGTHPLMFKDGKAVVDGALSADDPVDRVRKNRRYKVYTMKMKSGMTYVIDMRSKEIDAFLRLENSNGKELADDDDSGKDLNAHIVFTCPKDDVYRIICTTFGKAETGTFHLTVQKK